MNAFETIVPTRAEPRRGRPEAKGPRDFTPPELAQLREILHLNARSLTRVEVAALFGYGSTESIKRAERSGRLRPLKINARVTRYEPQAVNEYLAAARVA